MHSLALKPFELIERVRLCAGAAACKSPIYNWLLSSGPQTQKLRVKLTDPWGGDDDTGRLMVHGVMRHGGANLKIDRHFWTQCGPESQWQDYVHGFSWLRHLRAAGGDVSRQLARKLVEEWIDQYDRWDADLWRIDLMGERISMWLSFYDYFCASADEHFQCKYFASINRQARHLARAFPSQLMGVKLLHAARGLIYAGMSFQGRDQWILQGFATILNELPRQITLDGGHVTGSPERLLDCAKIALDLRYALNRANLPVPKTLQNAIERIGPALRFFTYPDRKLGVHHGGQECQAEEIDAVLSQIRGSKRSLKGLSLAGFERVMIGRSFLMFDHSDCPPAPFDRQWHSAPLSFEFAYGRDRIFGHCGGHPTHEDWQQSLRATAAHNTLTINGRTAHDITPNGGINRRPGAIDLTRTESKDACLIDAIHSGYMAAHGVTHRRRLFLSDQGHDLRGEDSLTSSLDLTTPKDIAIRFHIHPKVQLAAREDDQEIGLLLPSGSTWRFFGVGAVASIEESVYLGTGLKPIKTRQIILRTAMSSKTAQIKWALQRDR